jgi:hypothetical protein
MQVNDRFFQRELGIMAGFPCFSCHATQATNSGMSAMAMLSIIIIGTSFSLDVLAVRILLRGKLDSFIHGVWLTQRRRIA